MIWYSLSSCLKVGKLQQTMQEIKEAKNETQVAETAIQKAIFLI